MSVLKRYTGTEWQNVGGKLMPTNDQPICFYANKGGINQTGIGGATITKITFPTEIFDNGDCYDTSTSKFQPKMSGKYFVSAQITNPNLTSVAIYIYKNGVEAISNTYNNTYASSINMIVDMNGTTDYIEIYGYLGSGGSVYGNTNFSFFQAALLQSNVKNLIPINSNFISKTGMIAWFDCSNTASQTLVGSKVSQLNDLSGNGYHAVQTDDTKRPTYVDNSINGLRTLSFNSSSLYFTVPQFNVCTIIFVANIGSSQNASETIFGTGGAGATPTNGICWGFGIGNGADGTGWGGPTSNIAFQGWAINPNMTVLRVYQKDSAKWKISENGSTKYVYADTSYPIASFTGYIGVESVGLAYPLIGSLCELIIYNRTITGFEKQTIERYLKEKWDI